MTTRMSCSHAAASATSASAPVSAASQRASATTAWTCSQR